MDNIRTLHGDLIARDLRITIIASRFNDAIVENLLRGAVDASDAPAASFDDAEDVLFLDVRQLVAAPPRRPWPSR